MSALQPVHQPVQPGADRIHVPGSDLHPAQRRTSPPASPRFFPSSSRVHPCGSCSALWRGGVRRGPRGPWAPGCGPPAARGLSGERGGVLGDPHPHPLPEGEGVLGTAGTGIAMSSSRQGAAP
ncbi:Hypothetical protein AA314_03612 [Archangium gephyra]|uniref:Uncharacterized protein n=1 Tax=Archangium gephyra TaxID=48 RepID=A0AAC8Q7G6_9BACT|nr:Hypothetical protein AA314_03612 [Archangium gephyra]